MANAILLVSCSDHRGINASLTSFVYGNNGNIVHADQHVDEETNTFFMRLEWALDGFAVDKKDVAKIFAPVADKFGMTWEMYFSDDQPRMAIFVSKHLHCLYDILYRYRAGQLDCIIPLIISNHADAKKISEDFDVPFFLSEKTKDNKIEQERMELELLQKERIDTVVLARYHQIFSSEFVKRFENKMINIHHSFLPAFVGGSPYRQAYQKGVKLIGATSHYVTEALDQGPIIEQDTVRISHRDSVQDLIEKGEDLERVVFARAIRWHLERKVLSYNTKTVIFD